MPNTPDSITICGVLITRQQWELINQHGTWEAFVAANTPKPEHYDGEPCNLPMRYEDENRADGFRFEFTGKQVYESSSEGWFHTISNHIMWGRPAGGTRWELRAVRIEPKHKVGDRFVYAEGHPYVLSSYGLPNPCEFEFVRFSTTKHAGEAIYFSEICPVDFSSFRSEWKLVEPRWILRPVIKPKHVKGGICNAPVHPSANTDGIDHFLFNEFVAGISIGTWILTNCGEIWRLERDLHEPRWTLTAVPKQPAPRYDVGKWVVETDVRNHVIFQVSNRVTHTSVGWKYENKDHWIKEANLRPAVREDFMKEFGGVKVWMEEDHTGTWECNDKTTKHKSLSPWEVERNLAAGIMPMPEEFWI